MHLFWVFFSSVFLPGCCFFSSLYSPGLRPSCWAMLSGGTHWLVGEETVSAPMAQWYVTSWEVFRILSREPGEKSLCSHLPHPPPHPRPADRDMETEGPLRNTRVDWGHSWWSLGYAKTNPLAHTHPSDVRLRKSSWELGWNWSKKTAERLSSLRLPRILFTFKDSLYLYFS